MIDFNNLPCLDKIYYKDEDSVIYCADCREILPLIPDKSIDLVLTDPPYGINYAGAEWDTQSFDSIMDWFMPLLNNKISEGSYCYVWSPKASIYQFNKHFQDVFIVVKDFGQYRVNMHWFDGWYPLLVKVIGKPKSELPIRKNWFEICSANTSKSSYRNFAHETPKPMDATLHLTAIYSLSGDLILDPFLGSGTTAYCAKKLNRRSIGIEISEEYCKIAVDRLRQGVMRFDK